jgi:8-hydroxy-5-deazaflavin:NADPH oxidoreductase
MKIAVLGTGSVGKAFATRLTNLGHEVYIGTRDTVKTLEKTGSGTMTEFLENNSTVKLTNFADASAFGELIINVSKGEHTLDVIKAAGLNNLAGKIIIDISNPLDFSRGMPPSLFPQWSNTNSLGEEIQKMVPLAKVVKTLNTMWNGLMLDPTMLAAGDHINYMCGNDAESKKTVILLLNEFGWRNENILDLGDITASRATEATLPIWLRIYGAKQTGAFNFKIVF